MDTKKIGCMVFIKRYFVVFLLFITFGLTSCVSHEEKEKNTTMEANIIYDGEYTTSGSIDISFIISDIQKININDKSIDTKGKDTLNYPFDLVLGENNIVITGFNDDITREAKYSVKRITIEEEEKIKKEKERLAEEARIKEENRIKEEERVKKEQEALLEKERIEKEKADKMSQQQKTEEEKKQYYKINYDVLKKNAKKHSGEKIKFTGRISQATEDEGGSVFQIFTTGGGYDGQYMVVTELKNDFIAENWVTVRGILGPEEYCYTSVAGWNICVPLVRADIME